MECLFVTCRIGGWRYGAVCSSALARGCVSSINGLASGRYPGCPPLRSGQAALARCGRSCRSCARRASRACHSSCDRRPDIRLSPHVPITERFQQRSVMEEFPRRVLPSEHPNAPQDVAQEEPRMGPRRPHRSRRAAIGSPSDALPRDASRGHGRTTAAPPPCRFGWPLAFCLRVCFKCGGFGLLKADDLAGRMLRAVLIDLGSMPDGRTAVVLERAP